MGTRCRQRQLDILEQPVDKSRPGQEKILIGRSGCWSSTSSGVPQRPPAVRTGSGRLGHRRHCAEPRQDAAAPARTTCIVDGSAARRPAVIPGASGQRSRRAPISSVPLAPLAS